MGALNLQSDWFFSLICIFDISRMPKKLLFLTFFRYFKLNFSLTADVNFFPVVSLKILFSGEDMDFEKICIWYFQKKIWRSGNSKLLLKLKNPYFQNIFLP